MSIVRWLGLIVLGLIGLVGTIHLFIGGAPLQAVAVAIVTTGLIYTMASTK
jgi:hypothetical protein